MAKIYELLKTYFLWVVILELVSYLAPKEKYRPYFKLLSGAVLVVLILEGIGSYKGKQMLFLVYDNIENLTQKIESVQYKGEEESLIDIYWTDNTQGENP